MRYFLLLWLLCTLLYFSIYDIGSLILCDLTCINNQVYVKIYKQNSPKDATEESYEIYSSSEKLVTSPPFANNELRISEYCLDASTNSQYIVKMKDSYGDSWSDNSWIKIEGLYGNIVFKNFMTEKNEESYPFSLYYAIKKGQEWTVEYNQQDIASTWKSTTFDDSNWKKVNLGAPTETTSGTQYFRKSFTGLTEMAAYELQMKYKYGIIAYINGNEIFRDNMSDGDVTSSTAANGSYQEIGYHGVIRPASEVSESNCMLAVELHILETVSQTSIDFDAFVAIYASSISEDKCYIYSSDVSVTSTKGSNINNLFDFSKASYYDVPLAELPTTVYYDFIGPRPYITGLRIWPSSDPDTAPNTFTLQGSMDSSSSWSTIINYSDAIYKSMKSNIYYGYFSANLYKSYRISNMSPDASLDLNAYEIQPIICSTVLPTNIYFESTSYTYYAKYEEIYIKPTVIDFTNCTISPQLPSGLILNAESCTLSGRIMSAIPLTTYTMTSVMYNVEYTGTFTLTIEECIGTLVNVVRTYRQRAQKESFVIKDATTQSIVLDVAMNSGQPMHTTVVYPLCLNGNKYTVTLDGQYDYWIANSFLYVYAILSDEDSETILRIRRDSNRGIPNQYSFNIQYSVNPVSQWYYKMGSIPDNWYNDEVLGWQQATIGSYPESSNQIQLYKYIFNVASIDNVAGFVLSIRYKYGCIIYLNGHEAFRNGVDGELTLLSMADKSYTDVLYRQISLPVKTMVIGESQSIDYIKQGSNTIAIALVAINANQKSSVFDCALRLMTEGSVSRAFDYTITSENIDGSPDGVCNLFYNFEMHGTCANNHWTITFDHDRREWISSISLYLYYMQGGNEPTQFIIKARNSNSEEWITIKSITGMVWSLVGQSKKLVFENNNSYNQYRLENFATGNKDMCDWKLGSIDLTSESTTSTIPDLVYPTTIEVYKKIEMGEVYANSNYYYDFTIQPMLPDGITLDPNNGMISGTCNEESSASYTINAKKYGGGIGTSIIHLSVIICTGGKGLVTFVVMADSYPKENSWKLYKGKDIHGEIIQQADTLKSPSSLNYADFCLPHDIYTIQLKDIEGDGIVYIGGYYLTVDMGEMVIDMGQLSSGSPSDDTISTSFTTFIPFQIEYDNWKLFNNRNVDNNWTNIDFDDTEWLIRKAAMLGPHIGTTAYLRHDIQLSNIADYHVLNIRMKYAGGIVVYFNSHLVARFNLEENFDAKTEALHLHDATLFSKFHIILSTVGAQIGKNVIAFEIHRSNTESKIIFDATGIFGVNDCSVVVDTYSHIDGDVGLVQPSELFDLLPQKNGYIINTVGSKIEWTVENLEGTKYNSFGFQSTHDRIGLGFSVYCRWESTEDYVSAIAVLNQSTNNRKRMTWPMDVGIAGFKEFKYEIDTPANTYVYMTSFVMQYCKPSGTNICNGIDNYPSVGEGQISPAPCPKGFRGYSYRKCENKTLGDIINDRCIYKEPDKLTYAKENYIFVMDTHVTTGIPTYANIINTFYMQIETPLPEGLSINNKTGEITGIPTAISDSQLYTVRGANPVGETATVINIVVRKGICQPEGVFERTYVGETFIYNCAEQGSYIGTQKRECVLGVEDGMWKQASGFCMPVFAIVLIILIIIIVIIIIIIILFRTRKTKAIGGVKGKSIPAKNKNGTIKTVKV